jgi:hypothetical protein
MRKRTATARVLVGAISAFAVAAPTAVAAPPPLANHTVTLACDDVVAGGSVVNCNSGVTNNGSVADICTVRAAFTELGVVRTRTLSTGTLAPGETDNATFSFMTQDTNRRHNASFVLRVTCSSENGKQTTFRSSIVVLP